jgi:hypothetical protein
MPLLSYVDIVVVGRSAKGCNNLNVNSSSIINGLKYCRELLVDIEKQKAIEMEQVSRSMGMPDIRGRQVYFHFPELTTYYWDIYNQDNKKIFFCSSLTFGSIQGSNFCKPT